MIRFLHVAAVFLPASLGFIGGASGVEPKFPLGKDTTYVEGPLDDEGYIDYAEVLNEFYGRGVTPQNNAQVPLWRAIGPAGVEREIREKYFQRLGIDVPPENGDYFVPFEKFTANREPDPNEEQAPREQLNSAMGRPWKADEFPHIAEWLNSVEPHLAIVADAVKRPHYFRPVVVASTPQGRDSLFRSPVPGITESFDVARALAARAMLRTAEGKFDEAWQDLLSCHRLGRLVARGPFLVDLLVGYSLDNMAAAADIHYVAARKWTTAAAVAHAADLDRLLTMPRLADVFTRAERFMYLDSVRMIRRQGFDAVRQMGGRPPDDESILQSQFTSADVGPPLRNGNVWYDRLAAAARIREPAARNAEFRQIEADVKKLNPSGTLSRVAFFAGLTAGTPTTRGERIADLLAMLLLPTLTSAGNQEDRSAQQVRNVRVAVALAAFRAEAGRYPGRLDELVPKYLPEIPVDLFSQKPPLYRTAGDGYLLYSIGPDGEDDQGQSFIEELDKDFGHDDIVIRIPIHSPPEANP